MKQAKATRFYSIDHDEIYVSFQDDQFFTVCSAMYLADRSRWRVEEYFKDDNGRAWNTHYMAILDDYGFLVEVAR